MCLYQQANYQTDWPHFSWDIVVLTILRSDWPRNVLNLPNYILLNQILPACNLHQHAKSHAGWPSGSRDSINLAILKSYWLKAFFTTPNTVGSRILQYDWQIVFLNSSNKTFSYHLCSNIKKNHRLTRSLSKYNCAKNPQIWLAESIIKRACLKLTNDLSWLLNLYLHPKNQVHSLAFSCNIADLRVLRLIVWDHFGP